jgi:HK97 gp10 family phage protein
MAITVRVRKNAFPKVISQLRDNIEEEVLGAAEDLTDYLKGVLWEDTGTLRRVTTEHDAGSMHAEVWVGYYLGKGFYSGFQEFGTVKQAARPIVGPAAFEYEMVYAANMSKAVRRACDV